jgi:hypothetical protein
MVALISLLIAPTPALQASTQTIAPKIDVS